MKIYSYSIAVRIWHPTIDPAVISGNLGFEAKHAHLAGSLRMTPRGQPLGGRHSETYWMTDPFGRGEYLSQDDSVEDVLHEVVDRLKSHGTFLRLLREQGGRLHLQVSSYGARNYAIELPPAFMRECADMGLSFIHDVYPVRQNA